MFNVSRNVSDIVDGNLKSIMRLILALAAHFKPNSVRQTAQYDKAAPHVPQQSVAGIAQVNNIAQLYYLKQGNQR